MIKHGITGAATCTELFEPHYQSTFHLGAMDRLEQAILSDGSSEEVGEALAGMYRMSDIAGPYLEFSGAPVEIQDLHLCLRDAAKALIQKAGQNPDDYNRLPIGSVPA